MEKMNIRFPVKEKPEFMKELRGAVMAYFETHKISQYGNSKLVLKTIFMMLLYLIPYFLMISGIISSFAGVLACWVFIGLGKAGVGMGIMHDANHRSYSRNMRINQWMGATLYLLGGFPPNWRYQHNTLHHGYTNIEGHDEDIDPGSFLRLSPHKPLLKIHRYQHVYAWFLYGLMTLFWVTGKEFSQLIRYKKSNAQLGSKSYKKLLFLLIVSKLIYYIVFLIIPILVLPFAWYLTIVLFLAMHFTSGFVLTVIFQTAHVVPSSEYPLPNESGKLENNWAIHQLLTTTDFSPKNRVLSWFIGGLNYQIEHHLFPNISHVHYRKIAPIVREKAAKYGIPYYVQSTFRGAILSHAQMLKQLGRPYPQQKVAPVIIQ
jgi:linoleoyl-CoA desaturase